MNSISARPERRRRAAGATPKSKGVLLLLVFFAACAAEEPAKQRPAPKRHTWDDDEIRKIDFPEETTKEKPVEAKRPVEKRLRVALLAYDVISWDDVKIRGGARGSAVRGVVSLTGWLKSAKDSSRTEAVVPEGREASLEVPEALRDLVGSSLAFRVAVLEATDEGQLELAVTPVLAGAEEQVSVAARIRIGPGEAVVLGGHRSEEGESPRKKDQLVILTGSATR